MQGDEIRTVYINEGAYALIFAASPFANGNNDEYAQQLVDDEGRRLLSSEYSEEKWAKAAAAARDVIEGKRSEMDGLVYEVVRMGREYKVSMPQYEKAAACFREQGIL